MYDKGRLSGECPGLELRDCARAYRLGDNCGEQVRPLAARSDVAEYVDAGRGSVGKGWIFRVVGAKCWLDGGGVSVLKDDGESDFDLCTALRNGRLSSSRSPTSEYC